MSQLEHLLFMFCSLSTACTIHISGWTFCFGVALLRTANKENSLLVLLSWVAGPLWCGIHFVKRASVASSLLYSQVSKVNGRAAGGGSRTRTSLSLHG